MTDPTPLSPAAQAVLDAFRAVPDLRDCPSIAAAIRAAADHVPDPQLSAHMLYAIADELDGIHDIITEAPTSNDHQTNNN